MKTTQPRPIIVKRKKVMHGGHGGAWKIAFADFMTAMMALFLVLWILATSNPETRKAVAEYFRTPLSVSLAGGDRDTASDSAIPGGGPDAVYIDGETQFMDMADEIWKRHEREDFIELKRILDEAISLNDLFDEVADQVIIDLIPEGLRIQLIDSEKRPMFKIGSAEVEPYMKELLRVIAPIINKIPNSIQISGHTDSLPYAGGYAGYSNWELSGDRANASRRELVAGGLDNEKLIRVSGMADKLPFDPAIENINDSRHRRIAIIVVSRFAKHRILNQAERVITPQELKGGLRVNE